MGISDQICLIIKIEELNRLKNRNHTVQTKGIKNAIKPKKFKRNTSKTLTTLYPKLTISHPNHNKTIPVVKIKRGIYFFPLFCWIFFRSIYNVREKTP